MASFRTKEQQNKRLFNILSMEPIPEEREQEEDEVGGEQADTQRVQAKPKVEKGKKKKNKKSKIGNT